MAGDSACGFLHAAFPKLWASRKSGFQFLVSKKSELSRLSEEDCMHVLRELPMGRMRLFQEITRQNRGSKWGPVLKPYVLKPE